MKKIIFFFIPVILIAACRDEGSINTNSLSFNSDDYLVEVDSMPGIIGGIEAIQQNIKYPPEAKEKGIEGKVIVKVFVDEKGNVINTGIIRSDDKLLEQAAEDAIKMTKFTSGTNNGEPVKTQIVIPIVFKLDGKTSGEQKENKYPDYLTEVDEFPMPVGGMEAIGKNIKYPENERKQGIQGQVVVVALISETGEVIKTEISSGVNKNLDNAAMEAIKKTKFSPGIKDDKAVKTQVQIPVSFKLQ